MKKKKQKNFYFWCSFDRLDVFVVQQSQIDKSPDPLADLTGRENFRANAFKHVARLVDSKRRAVGVNVTE